MKNLISFFPNHIKSDNSVHHKFFSEKIRAKKIPILINDQLNPIHKGFIYKRSNIKVLFRDEPNMRNEGAFKEKMISRFNFTATKFTHNIINRKKRVKFSKSRKHITDNSPDEQFMSTMNVGVPQIFPRESRHIRKESMRVISKISTLGKETPCLGGRPKEMLGVGNM